MKGRHTSGDDGQRWAPNAKQAALSIAPMTALVIALGAGGAGLALHRADLAAAGAASGAFGVALEQANSRAGRRRLRTDRAQLRARIRELELAVAEAHRERDAAPSVLRPTPPPSPTTGPLPIVDAFDRAASPATPRSLPILTSNRRGLQSCAPGLPGTPVPARSAAGLGPLNLFGLPAQRPPATPITGLEMSMTRDPSLPVLPPGPGAPVLATAGVPVLEPGPTESVEAHSGSRAGVGRHAGHGRHAVMRPEDEQRRVTAGRAESQPSFDALADLALIGAALADDLAAAAVVDLRTVPERHPATATMAPDQVEALVYASISSAAAQDDFVLTLERPEPRPASLFEPASRGHHDAGERSVVVDQAAMRQLAEGARAASRAMRPGVPPSPFFTPGAFVPDDAARTAS